MSQLGAKQSAALRSLDKQLADQKELVLKDIDTLHVAKSSLSAEIFSSKKTLADTVEAVTRLALDAKDQEKTKAQLEGDIAKYEKTLATIEQEVKSASDMLVRIQSEKNIVTSELLSLKNDQGAIEKILQDANYKIAIKHGELDDLDADLEQRRLKIDDELRGILLRTSDAVARLSDIEAREHDALQNIALERQKLSKERETLDRRSIRVTRDEEKAIKYKRLMNL